jgi:hypothetical protein
MDYLMEYLDFSDIDDIDECDGYPDFDGYDEFCRFLKDNGVLDKFIDNYNAPSYGGINIFLRDVSPIEYITSAFYWGKNGEDELWYNIDKKWRDLLKNR